MRTVRNNIVEISKYTRELGEKFGCDDEAIRKSLHLVKQYFALGHHSSKSLAAWCLHYGVMSVPGYLAQKEMFVHTSGDEIVIGRITREVLRRRIRKIKGLPNFSNILEGLKVGRGPDYAPTDEECVRIAMDYYIKKMHINLRSGTRLNNQELFAHRLHQASDTVNYLFFD